VCPGYRLRSTCRPSQRLNDPGFLKSIFLLKITEWYSGAISTPEYNPECFSLVRRITIRIEGTCATSGKSTSNDVMIWSSSRPTYTRYSVLVCAGQVPAVELRSKFQTHGQNRFSIYLPVVVRVPSPCLLKIMHKESHIQLILLHVALTVPTKHMLLPCW
jgi:hypothetical protein